MKDSASSFWKKRSDKLKKENRFEESIEAYDKFIEKDDKYKKKDYWYKKGRDFFEILNWDEAITCFENDLQHNEVTFDSLFYKGVSLYKLEKYFEAIECFNKAWESRCGLYMKYVDQSKTLTKFKEFEQAIEYGNKASQVDLPPGDFWLVKGVCLYKIAKYDESKLCFDNGLEEDPQNSTMQYFLAKCNLKLENPDECISILKKCAKNNKSLSKMLMVDDDFNELNNNPDFAIFLDNPLL
ncbi:hypothetical protein C5F47_03410 [Nitrosopumilus cobalaminigenes]|uniref:Uncharacterized protein n=1 Tax=Nitrosopumilus cobalaminigenes TaxID=1470066 RepID=A0A7D5LYZ4_9ARCH|nr:tetratricopeptide repeat protein [Nitrosopumilus cobalaminigenes]QLH02674.1 hypothetical protein C5F47_03410 [Nitrosopumilus cobalaminigenes]